MEQDLQQKLEEQKAALDAILQSVEKTRKYFLATLWITVILLVVPLVGLLLVVPAFLNSYSSSLQGLL